jgi:glucosamine--fructose-6-phosphate aminotransferase (isomerizing)
MLTARFRKTVRFFLDAKIFVGRDPRRIPPPALILFPLLPDTLCCGLAGILTLRRSAVQPCADGDLEARFAQAAGENLAALLAGAIPPERYLGGIRALETMERELFCLKGGEVFRKIFFDPSEAGRLAALSGKMHAFLAEEERLLEGQAGRFSAPGLEAVHRGLLLIRDLVWGLDRDILENIGKIVRLAGADRIGEVPPEAFPKYREMNFLLNSLDRLEVRGRDSAGIQISFVPADEAAFRGIIEGLAGAGLDGEFRRRTEAGDPVGGSIAAFPAASSGNGAPGARAISFIYKTAEIIGELGRNVRELRRQIAGDRLLHAFARLPVSCSTSFAHTRWASVGSITEENCHPVGNFTPGGPMEKDFPAYGRGPWTIHCALNGDIDNYPSLRKTLDADGVVIAPEVTTDTKIIPLRIERRLLEGCDLAEAFRLAVGEFEGAHAIAMVSNAEPGKIFLALRGSGQSLYVGIAPDRYFFSSELYGLVEETPFFLKMDGERPSRFDRPEAAGQILVLDQDSPGGAAGIRGFFYDGTPLPVGEADVRKAEITTRDIDRGEHPHFFLKEIAESALSVRKTLLGRYRIEQNGGGERVVFNLGEDAVPARVQEALRNGEIRRIIAIGQGTAAVAAAAVAAALERCLSGSGIRLEARVASELSGFCLEDDLRGTLVIPITQSGTTTDTNRAVAMAAQRGASVIAIVNRRQSDITTKADGVFYTSDGRDIEMAVASTKAFYSQIVAGNLLALFFAGLLETLSGERIAAEVRRLEQAPEMMGRLLARKEEIRRSVETLAGRKRYWAVVGSGPNKAAADEIRIKLSELCYRTISSDVVEDKKHIDLSAEPLILVCAAGSPEAVLADIVKDAEIFKAHKSAVVVFADEGEERFERIADAVIPIPRAPMQLSVILNTLAGHLWGYYAACRIDADALFLREFKGCLNGIMVEQAKRNLSPYECIADRRLRRLVADFSERLRERWNRDAFSEAGVRTMSDLVLLLKYAAGKLPLDDFRQDFPGGGEAASPIDRLDIALGHAVDELSRPIDAIRHQAKTVTVGTSRKEAPLKGVVFDLLRELGFSAENLLSSSILAIGRIQKAVASVRGHTLYAVNGLDADGKPADESEIAVVGRGGVSVGMRSRAERPGLLMGTKRSIAASGTLYAGQGKADGAPIVIAPLLGEGERIRHLLLVHVAFDETLSIRERKELLGDRLGDIRNLIQEYNLPWEERLLGEIPIGLLLGEPVEVIAGQIREKLVRPAGSDPVCYAGGH